MSTSSVVVQGSTNLIHRKPCLRSKNLPLSSMSNVSLTLKRLNPSYVSRNNLYLEGFRSDMQKNSKTKRNFVVYNNIDAGNPSPSGSPTDGNWKGWVLGFVISFMLSFSNKKLGPLAIWKNKFDTSLQRVEDTVEAGEKVAAVVEKEAEKWLDRLPDGWLKDALAVVEQGAEKASKFLGKVDNAIDEFQEKEEEIEKSIQCAEEKDRDSDKETKR